MLTLTLSGIFASCASKDEPEMITPGDKGQGEGGDDLLYFSMLVSAANDEGFDVDAPDYVDGTKFEHAVDFSGKSENVVIFLDSDWKYKGYSSLQFDRQSAQGSPATGLAEEISFVGFLRPDYHDAYVMPEYGVLVLNAHDIISSLKKLSEQTSASIDDVLALIDESSETHIAGRSGNYFTMASTAYLVKESNEWKHSIIFEIDREKIFKTRAQAIISPAAVAYVERMASKFTLKISGSTGGNSLRFNPDGGRAQVIVCNYVNGEPNYNNRTWTLTVTGWGINKYEPTSYYFRNIVGPTTDINSYPYSYGSDINSTGKPFFNGWNRTIDRRCFWAVDPNYEGGIYPAQYRPAVDNPKIEYYGKSGAASLGYISYDELSTDFSKVYSDPDGAVLYSTENTFPDTHIGGLWQHDLAASQLVIGAKIHINRVSENAKDYDLFRNRIGVFFPTIKDFAEYFISTLNNQLSSQSTMSFRYYDWAHPENNTGTVMHSLSIPNNGYKLYYGDKPLTAEMVASIANCTLPAYIENGDGKVIPWVEGMYIARRHIDPDTYEEVGDIIRLNVNANDFKSLIYDWLGAFDHFSEGRMVYSVPILYRAGAEKVTAGNYRPMVGDFGVVRNTWYRFDLRQINSIGTPIDDPAQKIIPYESSLENSLMMEVKVLDWHEFSTTVVLPGNTSGN